MQKSKRKQRKEAEVAHDETEHEESVPTPSNDPLPSGEDSMQLNDLMVLCTKLQKQVLDLEKKVGAARRIESSNDSLGAQEDASKQGRRIKDIDADAEVTLVNETQERQDEDLMFDTGVLDDDEVFVDVTTVEKEEQSTKTGEAVTTAGVEDSAAPTIPTTVEETLAQTLMEIKAAKPKAKGIVFHDLEKQAERQKARRSQHNIVESWKVHWLMIEVDRLLAERLQNKWKRADVTDEEKGKLFMELMRNERTFCYTKQHIERETTLIPRHKMRSQLSYYSLFKNTGGYKHKQFMGIALVEIKSLLTKELNEGKLPLGFGSSRLKKHCKRSRRDKKLEDDKKLDEHEEVEADGYAGIEKSI
ncbi:hypothetical protein Tco_0728053 [Tanacetum coccineum]|uniref:Uncharacterized protein n=1 Tax=Tanacetum coccineum TaxID=301880 RepID=A0ABQ4YMM4_9ASTR